MSDTRPPAVAELQDWAVSEMRAVDAEPDRPPLPNGEEARLNHIKRRRNNQHIWCRFYGGDHPTLLFEDHGQPGLGLQKRVHPGNHHIASTADAAAKVREYARRQAEQAERQAAQQAKQLKAIREEYDAAGPADPNHAYIQRKLRDLAVPDVHQSGSHLYAAIRSWDDEIQGMQCIAESGEKWSAKGTKKSGPQGGHFMEAGGDRYTAGIILISEGLMTGATIHAVRQDLNSAVLSAIDASNLKKVAMTVREHRPDALIGILADNDRYKHPTRNPGLDAANEAAAAVGGIVLCPRFSPRHHPSDGSTKGPTDFNDLFLLEGPEEVRRQMTEQLAAQAPGTPDPATTPAPAATTPAQPSAAAGPEDNEDGDTAEILRLAGLKFLDYDRERKPAASLLGVSVGALDKVVRAARAQLKEQARPPLVFPVEPWPVPVTGADLAADLVAVFARYVMLPKGAATATTLWAIATWTFNAFGIFPKLLITSPEKRCGKSTFITLIAALVFNGLTTSNITAASIFRSLLRIILTLCIDEGDTFLDGNEEMRGIINGGHTKATAFVIRTEKDEATGELEAKRFTLWAPMAIAMIKDPPDTIRDRSVNIRLRRRLPGETVAKLPVDVADTDEFKKLRSQCARWGADHLEALRDAKPQMPQHPNDRALDNWTPLFAVADALGGDWPQRALAAFNALTPRDDDDDSIGPMILADVNAIFSDRKTTQLHSCDLVKALAELEDRPWSTWKRGKPITGASLAKILKPFGIESQQLRINFENRNGYALNQFSDAFARYLTAPQVTPPFSEEI